MHAMLILVSQAQCIYQRKWAALNPVSIMPAVPPSVDSIAPLNGESKGLKRTKAVKDADDAKLVFGVVYSLRNMVRRLGGNDDE